jgi:hypothetical protein
MSNTNIPILSLLLNALKFTIIFALGAKRGCEPPKETTAIRNETDYLPPYMKGSLEFGHQNSIIDLVLSPSMSFSIGEAGFVFG